MKFLIAVLMIHFIIALIDKSAKQKNTIATTNAEEMVKHPAEFVLR